MLDGDVDLDRAVSPNLSLYAKVARPRVSCLSTPAPSLMNRPWSGIHIFVTNSPNL